MPSYGLIIYNDNYEVQVDGLYRNFSLHDSGSWSLSDGWEWYGFTPTINPPIIATQPLGIFHVGGNCLKNNSYEYYVFGVYGTNGYTLPYLVFTESEVNEIPSGAYGLAVYNEYGNLVFHTNNKWCRLISFSSFSTPDVNSYVDITVEDADNNYFLLRPLARASDGRYLYQVMMKKINSTTIRVEGLILAPGDYGTWSYWSDISNLIEINV